MPNFHRTASIMRVKTMEQQKASYLVKRDSYEGRADRFAVATINRIHGGYNQFGRTYDIRQITHFLESAARRAANVEVKDNDAVLANLVQNAYARMAAKPPKSQRQE
jgi:hypothetical protein